MVNVSCRNGSVTAGLNVTMGGMKRIVVSAHTRICMEMRGYGQAKQRENIDLIIPIQ